jgi:single-stranded-DNA-specific exonuclease
MNLHAALTACSEHLLGYGGHAAAAGLKIEESRIDAFRAAFCEHAAGESSGAVKVGEIRIDAEGPFCQLTTQTVWQIESLAPFGCGNPRPMLCATGVRLAEPPKRMGASERHLSVNLLQQQTRIRGVAFSSAEWADELAAASTPLDVVYKPVINEFRGRQNVEIHLVDWRLSSIG